MKSSNCVILGLPRHWHTDCKEPAVAIARDAQTKQPNNRTRTMQTLHLFTTPLRWSSLILALLFLALTPLRAADATVAVDVQCSPSTVVLHSVATGDCLTVHTDLRFSSVDRTMPVELNGLAAYSVFSDNRGNLVAKFNLTALRELLTLPSTTLTLTGMTTQGQVFSGADVVRVVK